MTSPRKQEMRNEDHGIGRRTFLGTSVAATLATGLLAEPSAANPAKKLDRANKPGRTQHTPFAVNVEMWYGNKSFLEKINLAADMGGMGFIENNKALRKETNLENPRRTPKM